jgi:spore coat protein CotH
VLVDARVTVDGHHFENVGVSFRGASSFFMVPDGSKRSLKLVFDFVDGDANIGGYRTLNLLNSNGDPSMIRGVLYSAIAREYIPAPRVNLVRVVINGENWGVYSSAQQFNRDCAEGRVLFLGANRRGAARDRKGKKP